MRYSSVNNIEIKIENEKNPTKVAADVNEIISHVQSQSEIVESPPVRYTNTIFGYIWGGTILLSYIIWITCTVSLILNCTRKNVGKAVFSGVGLVVPLISIFISTFGKTIYETGSADSGAAMIVWAAIMAIAVEVIAFIFCFPMGQGDGSLVQKRKGDNDEKDIF